MVVTLLGGIVTLRGNVGSLDAPRASQLFTFGPRGQGVALRGSLVASKNPQKIGEANGMHSLPIGPTQVTKTGNVGSVDVFISAQLFTFGPRGQGNALKGLEWSAQSAHCAHTGHLERKCGFSGRSYSVPTIHIWP